MFHRPKARAARVLLTGISSLAPAVGLAPTASAAPLDDYESVAGPMSTFPLKFLDDFVPQGIAYKETLNRFFVTHYNWRDSTEHSRIAIHGGDGSYKKYVRIASGHVGGIAIWRDWLYVTSDGSAGVGTLRRYSLDDVASAANGSYVSMLGIQDTYVGGSAFATVHGGQIYFGSHTKDSSWSTSGRMWSWKLDPDTGIPTPTRTDATPTLIPPNVQGMVMTGDHQIFSQSWRRRCHSRFTVVSRDTGTRRRIYGPSMSQGIVNAGGTLFIAYESASTKYRNGDGGGYSLHPIDTAHYANLSAFASRVLSQGNTGYGAACTD